MSMGIHIKIIQLKEEKKILKWTAKVRNPIKAIFRPLNGLAVKKEKQTRKKKSSTAKTSRAIDGLLQLCESSQRLQPQTININSAIVTAWRADGDGGCCASVSWSTENMQRTAKSWHSLLWTAGEKYNFHFSDIKPFYMPFFIWGSGDYCPV